MPRVASVLVLFSVSMAVSAPLAAQRAGATSSTSDYGVAAVRPLYRTVKGYIMESAEQMPSTKYDYRPTSEVRSFGEILGHLVSDQYYFCSRVKGEPRDESRDFEKLGKSEMLAALGDAFEYCDALYSMSGGEAAEKVGSGDQASSRLYLLTYNVTHDWEHYGNLITYFRLNGMVPPSSQPR